MHGTLSWTVAGPRHRDLAPIRTQPAPAAPVAPAAPAAPAAPLLRSRGTRGRGRSLANAKRYSENPGAEGEQLYGEQLDVEKSEGKTWTPLLIAVASLTGATVGLLM